MSTASSFSSNNMSKSVPVYIVSALALPLNICFLVVFFFTIYSAKFPKRTTNIVSLTLNDTTATVLSILVAATNDPLDTRVSVQVFRPSCIKDCFTQQSVLY